MLLKQLDLFQQVALEKFNFVQIQLILVLNDIVKLGRRVLDPQDMSAPCDHAGRQDLDGSQSPAIQYVHGMDGHVDHAFLEQRMDLGRATRTRQRRCQVMITRPNGVLEKVSTVLGCSSRYMRPNMFLLEVAGGTGPTAKRRACPERNVETFYDPLDILPETLSTSDTGWVPAKRQERPRRPRVQKGQEGI